MRSVVWAFLRIYDRALSAAEISILPSPSDSNDDNEIFSDGFESQNLSAWSKAVL